MTDILDQIDDVLTDWHGSADAMHWNADPDAAPDGDGRVVLGFDGSSTDGDVVAVRRIGGSVILLPADAEALDRAVRAAARRVAVACTHIAAAYRAAWDQLAPVLAEMARKLAEIDPKLKGYQHQPMPHLARPSALPINGRAYRRRRRTR